MDQHFPQIVQETVELDPAIEAVARDWFGFAAGPGTRITSHVADALEFVHSRAQMLLDDKQADGSYVLGAAASRIHLGDKPEEDAEMKGTGDATGATAVVCQSDMVIIDIDAKDTKTLHAGVMFPPAPFLAPD